MLKIDKYLEITKTRPAGMSDSKNTIQSDGSLREKENQVYLKLLPLMQVAAEQENQPIEYAKHYAKKLAIAFGDYDEAIKYLKRFEKKFPHDRLLVHDACLFSIPDAECDLELWQVIICKASVDNIKDGAFQLLPFAPQIEKYVNANRELLKEQVRERIEEIYREQFVKEYDELLTLDIEAKIASELGDHQNILKKNAKNKLIDELHKEFKLNANEKLSNVQLKFLAQEKHQSRLKDLEVEECNKWQNERRIFYQTKTQSVKLSTKEQYVTEQFAIYKKKIQNEVIGKQLNILSGTTSIATLIEYLSHVTYQRASENPVVAALFFKYKIPEDVFNQYLSLIPKDDDKLIPNIRVEGSDLCEEYQGFTLTKLPASDPRAAILGKLTSCCQSLGDIGASAAIDGITYEGAGFYVLTNPRGEIVSQCWAWRSREGNIVFDSVESEFNFRKKNTALITDMFTQLANDLVEKENVPRVLVGINGQTSKHLGVCYARTASTHQNHVEYTHDSIIQRVIAHHGMPFLNDIYRMRNANSPVKTLSASSPTREDIFGWVTLCVYNNDLNLISLINPFLQGVQLTQKDIDERIQLIIDWRDLFSKPFTKNDFDKLLSREPLLASIVEYDPQKIRKKIHYLHIYAPCYIAAQQNQWDCVRVLIENGANLSIEYLSSSLYASALKNNRMDIAKLLLEKGFDDSLLFENYGKNHLLTPLADSATSNFLAERDLLAKSKKLTPENFLFYSLNQDAYEELILSYCKEYLENKKVDVNATQKDSNIPNEEHSFLFLALQKNYFKVVAYLANLIDKDNFTDKEKNGIYTLLTFHIMHIEESLLNNFIDGSPDEQLIEKFKEITTILIEQKILKSPELDDLLLLCIPCNLSDVADFLYDKGARFEKATPKRIFQIKYELSFVDNRNFLIDHVFTKDKPEQDRDAIYNNAVEHLLRLEFNNAISEIEIEIKRLRNNISLFSVGMNQKASIIEKALNLTLQSGRVFTSEMNFLNYKEGDNPSIQDALNNETILPSWIKAHKSSRGS